MLEDLREPFAQLEEILNLYSKIIVGHKKRGDIYGVLKSLQEMEDYANEQCNLIKDRVDILIRKEVCERGLELLKN